jgi:hypothetical protein
MIRSFPMEEPYPHSGMPRLRIQYAGVSFLQVRPAPRPGFWRGRGGAAFTCIVYAARRMSGSWKWHDSTCCMMHLMSELNRSTAAMPRSASVLSGRPLSYLIRHQRITSLALVSSAKSKPKGCLARPATTTGTSVPSPRQALPPWSLRIPATPGRYRALIPANGPPLFAFISAKNGLAHDRSQETSEREI